MSRRNRSISQRLAKAKSIERQQEVALDWVTSWRREQLQIVRDLEQAISQDDYDKLCIATGQLKAVTIKKFAALPNVIVKISGTKNER